MKPARPGVVWPRLLYLLRFGRLPNLRQPERFSELVHARKLFERDPRWPTLADKVAVKHVVAETLGADWVIPTLWHGTRLPDTPPWPRPFVIKSSHASQQTIFVREGDRVDWPAIQRRTARWLRRRYAIGLHEWLYHRITPQLLVEPFVGNEGIVPVDYKLFVFGGRVELVQVDTDREHGHKRVMLDRTWRRLPFALEFPVDHRDVPRPASFDRMVQAAEALADRHDFARVDFYDVGGVPLFGEITLYPGSGLDRFYPGEWDLHLGRQWAPHRVSPPVVKPRRARPRLVARTPLRTP